MEGNQSQLFHQQVSALLGVWKGKGGVLSKSDDSVVVASYLEECSFQLIRKEPTFCVCQMLQKTKHAEKKKPMHAESGFFKFILSETGNDGGSGITILVEAGLTHPFPKGLVTELATGTYDGKKLKLTSTKFCRVSDVVDEKGVTKYCREYEIEADNLSYTQYLEDIPHLKCTMVKSTE